MCGIIGVHSPNAPLDYSSSQLMNAMALMHYRGPDAQDCFVSSSGRMIIGHLRLSIHDLTEAGKQPMHLNATNGLYSVVFNGEIYNFLEIKEELISLGYSFYTGTDTEVVLASYAAWGESCVRRFNGMFAIAIYENESGKLFLSRDRLGKKPLYYSYDSKTGSLMFASEIKALIQLNPSLSYGDLDPSLIDAYMTFGYTPGESTLYPEIKRLMPGHSLSHVGGKVEINKFWALHFAESGKCDKKSDAQWVSEGKSLFTDSLKLRLRSDVKVGVFLSGGLDSSAVVAGLSEAGVSLNTYSVKFDGGEYGDRYDETIHAKEVSSRFNTHHQTIVMTPDLYRDAIPDFVRTMDEPVTEAAALSLGLLSSLATRDVTVVLSGEGADELFGGYEIYRRMAVIERIRKGITPFGTSVASMLAGLVLPSGNKIRKYVDLANQPFEKRYRGVSVYPEYYRNMLYSEQMKQELAAQTHRMDDYFDAIFSSTRKSTLLSQMLNFDTHTWLVDDLLIKADRMSMRHSLELRCPFLDYRLVEFAAQMPDHLKIRNGNPKWIVKEWFKNSLPDSVINRPKLGFPTPLQQMFQGHLRDYVSDRLQSRTSPLYPMFKFESVMKLCQEHFSQKADHHTVLWQLLVLDEYLSQRKSIRLI